MTPFRSDRPEADGLRYRRTLAVGLLVSVALHALVAVAWRAAPGPGIAGARPPGPEARRSERWEADALRTVELAASEPATEIPPPPAPVAATSPDVSAARVAGEADLRGVELTPHRASDPGAGGDVARSAGGSSRARRPPVPRSVLPEWDPPDRVRGTEVVVRVHVDANGRPTGPVELRPPTPSRDFNRRLRAKVRAMEFSPARIDGRPVAGWATLTFVF